MNVSLAVLCMTGGSSAVVSSLLEGGADASLKDMYGKSVADYAKEDRMPEGEVVYGMAWERRHRG
ncbi:MAG: hypothetical protein LBT15_00135 [Synergistaceae bacterium]|nr:hypothetical protein [Synergistaceae bacterium]